MANKSRILKRTWDFLVRPSAKYSVIVIGGSCLLAGIVLWGGFNTAMEATNDLEFCISCHEMRDNVYPEYKKTIHFSNLSGVRAICSDCHVPKTWGYKLLRKIQASHELLDKITGAIDTPEKFEAHRLELATREWARMKASDSRECRNCHTFEAMRKATDRPHIYNLHMKAKGEEKTCIDCHKGIAHLLPRDYVEPDEE